jgi:hypothetical protein
MDQNNKAMLAIFMVAVMITGSLTVLPLSYAHNDPYSSSLSPSSYSLAPRQDGRRNRIVTLPHSSYHYADNHAMNPFQYHPDPAATPSSLPYWSSRNRDP